MGRVAGVDLGTKRIGVAIADLEASVATPLEVIKRGRHERDDHLALCALVEEHEVDAVVIGLPLTLDGKIGRAAWAAISEARRLATVIGVPVYLHDERFTTQTADRSLIEMQMTAQARRRVVDKVAAAVILQSWLDAGQPRRGIEVVE